MYEKRVISYTVSTVMSKNEQNPGTKSLSEKGLTVKIRL